ncbi:putative phospholipid-transporting ATPase [Tolypocladium ophioglossoides CBS 100239]|uniref:Phospholipid-transporting ATPase n=1 Tax=Tolypocladium ophioglossoides (strain CBS 100239) TaxID=1163406 RepID=A0A0L0NDC7_TOLOC|nr:putative phospholipid-transporting ATPase [Tolypocladium ophioglossoides CBS 100239]
MAPSRNDAAPGRQRDHRDGDGDDTRRDDAQAASNERHPPAAAPRRTNPRRSHADPAGPSGESFPPPSTRRSLADSGAWERYQAHELQPISSRAPVDDPEQQTAVRATHRDSEPPAVSTDMKASISYRIKSSIQEATSIKGNGRNIDTRRATCKDRASARLAAFYQRFIIEGLLRRIPLPPTKDGRHIPLNPPNVGPDGLIDERSNKPYIDNFIRSSRYTVYDFVPKQLIFQFSKLGNFYFLIMGVRQMIPGMSTVGRWTTIVPLGIFVAFSMAKEGYDDYRRYQLDKAENRSKTWVLSHGVRRAVEPARRGNPMKKSRSPAGKEKDVADEAVLESRATAELGEINDWVPVQWQHIQVGDVVRLQRDQAVPADMALLHATGPNGIAYIETMALDGETNLKSKQACTLLAERCSTMEGIKTTQATVVSEDPNLDLYSYDGRVTVDGETLPLSLNNVVYRGSTLRNTTAAIGLVINSGEECKIRMNANRNVRAKAPAMQSIINKMVLIQIAIVLALAGGLTAAYALWKIRVETHSPYLVSRPLYDASVPFKNVFFGYMVMFNTLIPLSLYISMEIIKIGQLLLMDDVDMYDPVTDTPMVANTTTILENLGQVSYVFSDKTGTLTENMMRFRKLGVAGVACLHDMDVQRDEEAKRRKVGETQKRTKGKERPLSTKPTGQEDETINDGDGDGDDDDDYDSGFRKRHARARLNSAGSLSHWRSNARPNKEPEMKTEELLDYIQRKPNTTFSRKAKHFLLCMALCHTCLPEAKGNGEIAFQAASPDELALVEAARDLGIMLIDRPAQSIKLQTRDADGFLQTETYQVLDVIEFSSKRKRMSIIIRMPDGRLCIFCKGADNVIMSRLKLNHLAEQKAKDIGRRASIRKTFEQDKAILRRMSEQASAKATPRTSFALKRAESTDRPEGLRLSLGRRSTDLARFSQPEGVGSWLARRQAEEMACPRTSADFWRSPRQSLSRVPSLEDVDWRVDESVAANEAAVFENCFQHIDDFASEGLRTLLYAYRYIDDEAYAKWKVLYREAETSLADRHRLIEEAGDLIEQRFELAGATAIEDKLQDGVPETIDKLRRANIKVWMLTGDKRETAINIGHSARLCKSFSEIYILDGVQGRLHDAMTATLNDVGRGMVPHSVLVVDGQTLATIEEDDGLAVLFNDLVVRVDSVICCRASPSQKANLVKSIRRQVPDSMTLAIGDGANDIGMIQASHVGIGISGREGLQAARISDYSIAQFRFLQKLLFVHGRWNYLRTGKYVLATFWKEMLFFLVQAHYQRMNGYSGTSLFESWSLTVFNSAFTSLPVILLGIFEKDLSADTLLAVPELYTFGQWGQGFNYTQYLGWMLMGVAGSFIIFFTTCGVYMKNLFTSDTSLFAMGDICFTVAVIFINVKLLILELHCKTVVTFVGLFLSIGGWFLWNILLSAIYKKSVGPYIVREAFLHNFGRTLQWWATVLIGLAMLLVLELVVQGVRRVYWPTDQDLMQRIEKDVSAGKGVAHLAAAKREKEEDIEMQSLVVERGRAEATKAEASRARSRSPPWSRISDEQVWRPRLSHDDYRPPGFMPPAEERENPFEAAERHKGG